MTEFDYEAERTRLLKDFVPPQKRDWWGQDTRKLLDKSLPAARIEKNLEKIRQWARSDFFYFCDQIIRDPNRSRLHVGLHDEHCWLLQHSGGDVLALLPRNHLKSTNGTVAFILWKLATNPDLRFVIFADTLDVSKGFLRAIKDNILFNPRLKLVFPDLKPQLAAGNAQFENWTTSSITVARNLILPEPSVIASSTGQNLVGKHFDYVIYDDIVTDLNANTDDKLKAITEWYGQTQSLIDRGGVQIVNGTRRDDGDVYGKMIDDAAITHMAVYRRQVIENEQWLWPTPVNIAWCEGRRAVLSPYEFSCQYMNDPIVKGEEEFSPDWIKQSGFTTASIKEINALTSETPDDILREFAKKLRVFLFLDPARTVTKTSDFSAFMVAGFDERRNLYGLEKIAGRFSDPVLISTFLDLVEKWVPHRAWVESIAGDEFLYRAIHRELGTRGLGHFAGKVEKAPNRKHGVSNADMIKALTKPFHDGKIHLPDAIEWADVEHQFLRFPYAKNDDLAVCVASIWQYGWTAGKPRDKEDSDRDRNARLRFDGRLHRSWRTA